MTNPSRPTRSGPALRTLLTFLSLAYVLAGTPLMAQLGSGLNATETTTAIAGSTSTDTLFADLTLERWKMNNHATGALPVAAWPCTTAGCIPYAAGTAVSGVFPETELLLGAVGVPLLAGSTIPQWGSVDLASVTALSDASGTKLATATGTLTTSQPAAWNGNGDLVASRGMVTSIPVSDTLSGAGGQGAFATTETVSHTGLATGSFIEIKAHGIFTTNGGTPLFNLEFNGGGTTGICPAPATAFTLNTPVTSGYWDATCYIQVNGASSISWGTFQWAGPTGASPSVKAFANSGSVVNDDTAADHAVALQETGTMVANQTFTLQAIVVRVTY
jgi:hypothetical protein